MNTAVNIIPRHLAILAIPLLAVTASVALRQHRERVAHVAAVAQLRAAHAGCRCAP